MTKFPNAIRRPFAAFFALGFLFLAAAIAINVYIITYSSPYIYTSYESLPEKYTVIVPGAAVRGGGKISHIFNDRIECAEEIYRSDKCSRIIISGDHGRKNYDEPDAALKMLVKNAIPQNDIFTDHAGFDTFDTMARAKKVFAVNEAVIATQEYHLYRSIFIARKLGIDAVGFKSDKRKYQRMRYYKFREFFSRLKAFAEIISGSRPKFYGPVIPINGSAEKSRG